MTKSTVPVGTSDKVKATVGATLIARGAQVDFDVVSNPGIPEGGRGDRGLHEAGPRRRRHRQPAHGRAAEGPLRPVHAQSPAHDHHGPALGRAHEVRGERHARDQDQLHERAREHRRAPRRGHRDDPHRHRLRSAHRLLVHLPGRGLRRLLLPEGRARRSRARRGDAGHDARILSAVEAVNDRQKHVLFEKISQLLRRQGRAAARSRSGASRSSRTPTTCARRRRAC